MKLRSCSRMTRRTPSSTGDSPLFDVQDSDLMSYVREYLRDIDLEMSSQLAPDSPEQALALLESIDDSEASQLREALKTMLATVGETAVH